MKERKHAAVLRAIADGEPLRNFEWSNNGQNWSVLHHYGRLFPSDDHFALHIRRKKLTHVVNGFKVAVPEKEALEKGVRYYIPVVSSADYCTWYIWTVDSIDQRSLERGLVFLNKEDAISNAKAMLGIDPTPGFKGVVNV